MQRFEPMFSGKKFNENHYAGMWRLRIFTQGQCCFATTDKFIAGPTAAQLMRPDFRGHIQLSHGADRME
jgi:hypothetical protein